MARPQTYPDRIDTKVRLRRDHADALDRQARERGVSRNLLIEWAVEAFLERPPVEPRLTRTPVDPRIVPTAAKATRTRPRLNRTASAMETQSERRTPRRTP